MTKPKHSTTGIDFTVTHVECTRFWGPWANNNGGIELSWQTESAGWGTTTFVRKGNKWECDNECMSRKFVMSVLKKWVDQMEFRDDPGQ